MCILSSRSGVLYVGCTCDLARRTYQHKNGCIPLFTKQYMKRKIKSWRREKKVQLIEATNPGWRDLALDWIPRDDRRGPSLRSG